MPTSNNYEPERLAWLSLNLVPEIGPVRFRRLVERIGSAREVLSASLPRLAAVQGVGKSAAMKIIASRGKKHQERLEQELATLANNPDIHFVLYPDPEYPAPLKDLYDPPMVLYLRGRPLPEDSLAVALVGTRRLSPYGKALAKRLGQTLAENSVTVVSGCAAGIDQAAQTAAINAGGRSLGVLGTGIDVVFPAHSGREHDLVAANGALISEFPLGTKPTMGNFPRRNRLIAALSLATVVIEAPERSGALITARFAAELGREVMACPGNAIGEGNRGSHALLKDGAVFVEGVEDILAAIGEAAEPRLFAEKVIAREEPDLTDDEATLLEQLSATPRHLDELTRVLDYTPGILMQHLLTLEMKGLAEQLPGMYYRRPF